MNYQITENCVNRLVKEWKKHGRLIIAIDFDDTIFDFHKTAGDGECYDRVWNVLREANKIGALFVIFTASLPERFDFMKSYFVGTGIEIAAINTNPIKLPFGNNGKIYYNILLDDRAGLGQSLEVLELAVEKMTQ